MTPTSPSRPARGFIYIALSAVLFGSIGVVTASIFHVATTNALSITLWRAFIALPILFLISLIAVGRKMFVVQPRDLRIMVLAGLMMSIYQAGFVVALQNVNVTIATLVTLGAVPIIAALLSAFFLHERLQPQVYLALLCALVGLVLLVGFQPSENLGAHVGVGVFFALLTAFGSASFQVCGRVLANRYHPMQALTVFFFVATLALLPVTLLNGFTVTYPPQGWLLLLHLGIGVSILGYLFLMLGLRSVPATSATIIALLEPLTGTLLAWMLLGERLDALGLIGGALMLAAMVIVFRTNAQTAEPL